MSLYVALLSMLLQACCGCHNQKTKHTLSISELSIDSLNSNLQTLRIIPEIPKCLPVPGAEFFNFLKTINFDSGRPETGDFSIDVFYVYLSIHFDSISEKQVEKVDPYWGPVEWNQTFSNDILYYHRDFVEIGSSGEIQTHCSERSDFYNVFTELIEFNQPESTKAFWKHDSTSYEPVNNDVGCYYKIGTDSLGFYWLKWYCGC